jgi:predicted RNA methylase
VNHGLEYNRQLLLLGAKRNAVLELSEVQRYGTDSYGDPDYVTIYGLRPADWFAKGVRLLGRTAVECTRDELANAVGKEIAAIAASGAEAAHVVLDPFAGSGNTLYWILRHLPGARATGFELDPKVFELTRANLSILGLPVTILNANYASELSNVAPATDELLVTFIAPPWGEALSAKSGLDLRRTTPAVTEIVDLLTKQYRHNRLVCAVQVHERLDHAGVREITQRFDWSALSIFDLNPPGERHGLLLGTIGWVPRLGAAAANHA